VKVALILMRRQLVSRRYCRPNLDLRPSASSVSKKDRDEERLESLLLTSAACRFPDALSSGSSGAHRLGPVMTAPDNLSGRHLLRPRRGRDANSPTVAAMRCTVFRAAVVSWIGWNAGDVEVRRGRSSASAMPAPSVRVGETQEEQPRTAASGKSLSRLVRPCDRLRVAAGRSERTLDGVSQSAGQGPTDPCRERKFHAVSHASTVM
jgi:hypothetical protein